MKKHLPLILLACGFAATLDIPVTRAQQNSEERLRFEQITMADGLSSNWINAIVQDHQGFMWFGTIGGGLNRYA